jgi:hypothetical protein
MSAYPLDALHFATAVYSKTFMNPAFEQATDG